jgi:hypothetical protein
MEITKIKIGFEIVINMVIRRDEEICAENNESLESDGENFKRNFSSIFT